MESVIELVEAIALIQNNIPAGELMPKLFKI